MAGKKEVGINDQQNDFPDGLPEVVLYAANAHIPFRLTPGTKRAGLHLRPDWRQSSGRLRAVGQVGQTISYGFDPQLRRWGAD
jgi:hypothetical protein